MDRRSFLAAALAAAAGCSDGSGGVRTVAPNLRGTPSRTPTPTPDPTATPRTEGDEGPRSVLLANDTHHDVDTRLDVASDGATVLETSPRLDPTMTAYFVDVLDPEDVYEVVVSTSEGHARTVEWDPDPHGGDLRIGLGRDVSVRDAFGVDASGRFLTGDTGVVRDAPDENWSPLVVDNPGEATPAQVAFSDGDGFAGVTLDVPARSRLRLPITVPSREVDVAATVAEREAHARWRPTADGPLPLLVDGPRFVCDTLFRSLRVENGTGAPWSAGMTVRADGRTAFTRQLSVAPGSTRAFRAAVPPAGEYVLRIEMGGAWALYELPDCPPVGPVVLTVDSGGIEVVARGLEGEEERGTTMTTTEPTDEPVTATENGTADGG